MAPRLSVALLVPVCCSACLLVPDAVAGMYVARTLSERSLSYGWYRADRDVGPAGRYADRFERIDGRLQEVPCEVLARGQRGASGSIYVLVHGLGGEGPEMQQTLPTLMASRPAAVFMFRWAVWDQREALVGRLAAGLSRLAACIPGAPGRLVVIAHSAGGVLASLAASEVAAPPGAPSPWLTVLTVAAPLSGKLVTPAHAQEAEPSFLFDLGSAQSYRPPAQGVRVLHLRTRSPADREMKAINGHAPNDVRVGVPGARQVNLPVTLTHAGALVYVARRLADGTFPGWVDERAQ